MRSWSFKGQVAWGLLFCCFIWLFVFLLYWTAGPRKIDINKAIPKYVEDLNRTCPKMMGNDIRLDSVKLSPDRTVVYHHTLVNLASADVSIPDLVAILRPPLEKNYKTHPMLKSLREAGVRVEFDCYDKFGAFLTKIEIDPHRF